MLPLPGTWSGGEVRSMFVCDVSTVVRRIQSLARVGTRPGNRCPRLAVVIVTPYCTVHNTQSTPVHQYTSLQLHQSTSTPVHQSTTTPVHHNTPARPSVAMRKQSGGHLHSASLSAVSFVAVAAVCGAFLPRRHLPACRAAQQSNARPAHPPCHRQYWLIRYLTVEPIPLYGIIMSVSTSPARPPADSRVSCCAPERNERHRLVI